MVAILLALGSSVGYGVSDFLASRVAKRVAPVLLVFYSQALQSVVLLVVVVAVRQPYSGAALAWGTAAGAVGAAGLVAYYQALATGQTAIVAPWPPAAPCSRCWSTWPAGSGRARWPWPDWCWSWAGSP
jgi:drug/metabolite transporter (DMT)-like permease